MTGAAPPLVLVVDDVEDNRDLYVQFLAHHGYRVMVAEDGEQGVALTRALRPAVVVMDLALPRMDGITATRLIKADPETAHVPVVCLTGSMGATLRDDAVLAGCDQYLTKPCLPEDLLAIVAALAGGAKPSAQARS